jgi:hypothetical protein
MPQNAPDCPRKNVQHIDSQYTFFEKNLQMPHAHPSHSVVPLQKVSSEI